MTLHGSMGYGNGSAGRVRNILQHGVSEWVNECEFDVLSVGFK